MSHKTKKLSPFKYKGRGLLLYQNLWHMPKLTKKQLRWSKFKDKVHSTEQGRPINKYRALKIIIPHWVQNTKAKKKTSTFYKYTKKMTTRTIDVSPAVLANTPEAKHCGQQSPGSFFARHSTGRTIYKNSMLPFAQKRKTSFVQKGTSQKVFQQKPKLVVRHQSSLDTKTSLSLIVKRQWFFDTAAPIPGVSFLKKRKRLQSSKQRAFKTIQSMLQIQNKKQMKSFFGAQKSIHFSKTWAAIVMMESMYQNTLCKRAFSQNAHQRNALAYSQQNILNGHFVSKLRSVNTIADLSILKNIPTAFEKLQSFYATKKLLFRSFRGKSKKFSKKTRSTYKRHGGR